MFESASTQAALIGNDQTVDMTGIGSDLAVQVWCEENPRFPYCHTDWVPPWANPRGDLIARLARSYFDLAN